MANEFKIKNGLRIDASTNSQRIIAVRNASTEITADASSILLTGKAIYDYVNSQSGVSSLAALTDVEISDISDNQFLKYDFSASKWKNISPIEASLLFWSLDTPLVKESSLGDGLFWVDGQLDVSVAGGTGDVTKIYVDGSLAERDASINWLNTNKLESDDLNPYATNASIGLAEFLKAESLYPYATNASVGLALSPYATNASVGLALSSKLNNTTDTFTGVLTVNGSLSIFGNIYQDGSSYITHAENIYTTKDFIIMRDGATVALADGSISGIKIMIPDGANNVLFGADNDAVLKIGWENDVLEAIATREDNPTNEWYAYWDDSSTMFKTFNLKGYIDGSLSLRDTSIAWLNTNKASLSNPSFSGYVHVYANSPYINIQTDSAGSITSPVHRKYKWSKYTGDEVGSIDLLDQLSNLHTTPMVFSTSHEDGNIYEDMRLSNGNVDIVGDVSISGIILAGLSSGAGYLIRDHTITGYGIYKGAADRIGIAENGNEILTVKGGNVGIGTTSPSNPLVVSAPSGWYSNTGSKPTLELQYVGSQFGRLYIGEDWQFNIENGHSSSPLILQGNGGNVGIGTTAPGSKLVLKTSDSDSDEIVAKFIHRASSTEVGAGIQLGGRDTNTFGVRLMGYNNPYSTYSGRFSLLTSNGDNVWSLGLTQNNDGKVGIGTITPSTTLDVSGNVHVGGVGSYLYFDTTGIANAAWIRTINDYQLEIMTNRGTTSKILLNDDGQVELYYGANKKIETTITGVTVSGKGLITKGGTNTMPTSISVANNYLQICDTDFSQSHPAYALIGFGYCPGKTYMPAFIGYEEVTADGETKGDLIFGTRSVTTDTVPTERMRITNEGKVGIGTNAPNQPLDVSADVACIRMDSRHSGGRTYDLYSHIPSISYAGFTIWDTTASAYRFVIDENGKVGIGKGNPAQALDVSGNIVASGTMTATNFILSSDKRLKTNIVPIEKISINVEYKEFELISEPGQKRYGVIAQDLQKINPELVRTDEKGILSVAYIDLLIKEIAALKERVLELEKKNQ